MSKSAKERQRERESEREWADDDVHRQTTYPKHSNREMFERRRKRNINSMRCHFDFTECSVDFFLCSRAIKNNKINWKLKGKTVWIKFSISAFE